MIQVSVYRGKILAPRMRLTPGKSPLFFSQVPAASGHVVHISRLTSSKEYLCFKFTKFEPR